MFILWELESKASFSQLMQFEINGFVAI